MTATANGKRTGFLNLDLGGTGALGSRPRWELWKADACTVPLYSVLIDTDQPNAELLEQGVVDACIPLSLTHDQIRVVQSTPASFGPTVEAIVNHVGVLLDAEDFRNGARTTRCLAQLLFEVSRDAIASKLNECLRDFAHRGGYDEVLPILTSSSGGGTGSALTILLAQALRNGAFRGRILQGLVEGILLTPVAFVVEPFYRAFAHTRNAIHTAKILGNAEAFRLESADCELHGCFKNIYHLGLSCSGGAVLDSEQDVARVLGTSVYQFEKHYAAHIKNRTVDDSDIQAIFGRYRGDDTPENLLNRAKVSSPINSVPDDGNGRAKTS